MEVKKYIRNKFYIFCIITVGICFLLGYFLLASLDKIVYPSITVLILQTFYNDYKNKNVLFYKLMGYDWLHYFIEKLVINFCCISIPTILGLLLVSIIYNDFSYLGVMIVFFECVISFQVLLECLWGFLFKSMMVGYMVNFAYWLFSIVFATANEKLSFFCAL